MTEQIFEKINLKGLINEDLYLYERIMNSYYNKISKITTISRINCDIKVNSIILNNTKNCIINLKNKCFSNVSNSLNLLIETIIENEKHMSLPMKIKLEKYLGISFDQVNNNESSDIYQRCNAFAGVTNLISVRELEIDNCNSFKPLEFNFYNTGDASANCGIIDLSNALGSNLVEEEDNVRKKFNLFLNKVLNFNLYDLFVLILIIFIIFSLLTILYTIFKRTKNIIYIYRFKKKN